MRKKLCLSFMIGLIVLNLMVLSPASAAVGIELPSTNFDDMSLTVKCTGLTVGTTYYVVSSPDSWTTNTTQITFIASSDSFVGFFSVDTPADKSLEVGVGTAADAIQAAQTGSVQYPDDDDVVNSDAIQNFITVVFGIVLPVLILAGIMKLGKK